MAATEKVKRPLIAHFLDVLQSPTWAGAEWERLGKNVTDASVSFNPQTETEQDIISDSATTEITGYQPNMPVSQQCTKGDPIFDFVTKLRRKRAVLGDSHSWVLNVDLYDFTGTGETKIYVGEVQECSVQVDEYGGAGGETPTQSFTINYIGDPIPVTISIDASGELVVVSA